MEQYHQNLIGILKRYLSDNDINIVSECEGLFELSHPSVPNVIITAQYVMTSPVNRYFHGSKNNTPIDTVARFLIPDLERNPLPKFFIFPLHNPKRGELNFAVVPSRIFIERAYHTFKTDIIKPPYEIVFWLMPDDCLYDCTNISVEGEWFFLSKGSNGRMTDDTDRNYTPFLNNWKSLVDI
jgi:hypothetical protein